MNALFEWISRFFGSWKFWIIISPWDIGIRIRFGKLAHTMRPGPHFRIPFFDEITIVNTRARITTTPTVTVAGGKANTARIVSATIGFEISDPAKALMAYTYPEMILGGVAQASLINGRNEMQCLDDLVVAVAHNGIRVLFVYYAQNVEVRTYRIINDGGGGYFGGSAPMVLGGDNKVSHY